MSTVCVMTPIVVGSWPMISTAVLGAASAMGFSVVSGTRAESRSSGETRVEEEIPNSEVMVESLQPGSSLTVERDGVRIEFNLDERGSCRLCVTGKGTTSSLRKIGQEVAGRVVQQFAYHKLVAELAHHNYEIVNEQLTEDESVQLRVRLRESG